MVTDLYLKSSTISANGKSPPLWFMHPDAALRPVLRRVLTFGEAVVQVGPEEGVIFSHV